MPARIIRGILLSLCIGFGFSYAAEWKEVYETARTGDAARIEKLFKSGVSPNIESETGESLLMLTAMYGNADAVKLLLDRGAEINHANKAGSTALMRAAGNFEVIKLLVDRGANVNAHSGLGNTPLMLIARPYGSSKSVGLLLSKGAEVNATNRFGAAAINSAAASGDIETVRLLLKHGADVNSHSRGSQEVTIFGGGRSPLMWASAHGDMPMAKLLLEAGADVNAPEGFGSALTQAAKMDRLGMAGLLLEHGANVNEPEQFSGFAALHWAASSEHSSTALVDLLLAHGADPNAEGGDPIDAYLGIGQTPLMLARRRGDTQIAAALAKAGGKENPFPKKTNEIPFRAFSGAVDAKAIKASIEFACSDLQKTAVVSKDAFVNHASKQDCVSCHQQYMPAAALSFAAKSAKVDRNAEEKLMEIVRTDFAKGVPYTIEALFHPEPVHSYGYALFAMGCRNEAPTFEMDANVHHLMVIQGKEGNWYNNLPRPPIQTGDVGATALGVYSLSKYGFPGRSSEVRERIERARKWLAKVQPDNTEERVYQILGLAWAGEEPKKLKKLAEALTKEQRADGGWAQLPKLETDAYASGQALYALRLAGVKSDSREVKRGIEFLLKTQRADGTWFVARRTFPFQPTMQSGFPHGRDSWISATGTSWAMIGLSSGIEENKPQASAAK